MTSNILDPSAVISLLPSLLPLSSKTLESSQDGIAALFHTALSVVGFRLIAVDESATAILVLGNVFPKEWNQHGPGHYTFRYRHDQSSLEFVVKVAKLGSRTLVNAIAVESDKTATLDISTDDYTSRSFFPHDLSKADAPPLVHGFIASNRVADLLFQFKIKIIQKLIPGLRKDGYSDESSDTSTNAGSEPPSGSDPLRARPRPQGPPLAPAHPALDPYAYLSHIPPAENPLQIGRRDLDPIPMGPYGAFQPPSLFPQNEGDGMYVGPNHPIFGARRGGPLAGRGPWGGDGYLPPMGAPPGARFDPVAPDFVPGMGGIGGIGGRRPGGRHVRDPDNDEFMPPGVGDMFM